MKEMSNSFKIFSKTGRKKRISAKQISPRERPCPKVLGAKKMKTKNFRKFGRKFYLPIFDLETFGFDPPLNYQAEKQLQSSIKAANR